MCSLCHLARGQNIHIMIRLSITICEFFFYFFIYRFPFHPSSIIFNFRHYAVVPYNMLHPSNMNNAYSSACARVVWVCSMLFLFIIFFYIRRFTARSASSRASARVLKKAYAPAARVVCPLVTRPSRRLSIKRAKNIYIRRRSESYAGVNGRDRRWGLIRDADRRRRHHDAARRVLVHALIRQCYRTWPTVVRDIR